MSNEGKHAFPVQSGHRIQSGMTLRAYFAGQALVSCYTTCKMGGETDSAIAVSCCKMADELIAELEKPRAN